MFAVAKQNAHGMQRLSARIQKLETNESRGLSGVCTFSGFIHIISCFFAHGMDLQLGLSSPLLSFFLVMGSIRGSLRILVESLYI